ncbi:MAG: hypothetical protein K4571_10000 [Deltaproteobacteria bacterium]
MTTNTLNPYRDYLGTWQVMHLKFTDGQQTNYFFLLSLNGQFFPSPGPNFCYFTFDPEARIVDDFQSMFKLYGIDPLPENLQLDRIDFLQNAFGNTTTAVQQQMIVDFVRVVEKEDTASSQTP